MTDSDTRERSIRNEERLDSLDKTVSIMGEDVKEVRGLVIAVMKNEIPHIQQAVDNIPQRDRLFWITIFTVGGVGYLLVDFGLKFIAQLLHLPI